MGFLQTVFHLFAKLQFVIHRLLGFTYLLQWIGSLFLFFYDYQAYQSSILPWSLPLNGFLQAVNASFYFNFLPKSSDPGYYSDKSVMSYNFVLENVFFSNILLFACMYNTDTFYPWIQQIPLVQNLYVFLPYAVIRPFVPQTSFRQSIANSKKNQTLQNRNFFLIGTYITSSFYMWAKHFIGFYLNYVRYFNGFNAEDSQTMHLMYIFSGFATTISLFLHTLKFQRYIGAQTSYFIYIVSYLSTFYCIVQISHIFVQFQDLAIITFIGLLINYVGANWHAVYQMVVLVLCYYRYESKAPLFEINFNQLLGY